VQEEDPAENEPADDMGFYDVAWISAGQTNRLLTVWAALLFFLDIAGRFPFGTLPLFSARLVVVAIQYFCNHKGLLWAENKKMWLMVMSPIYTRWLLSGAIATCMCGLTYPVPDKNFWWQERLAVLGGMILLAVSIEVFVYDNGVDWPPGGTKNPVVVFLRSHTG